MDQLRSEQSQVSQTGSKKTQVVLRHPEVFSQTNPELQIAERHEKGMPSRHAVGLKAEKASSRRGEQKEFEFSSGYSMGDGPTEKSSVIRKLVKDQSELQECDFSKDCSLLRVLNKDNSKSMNKSSMRSLGDNQIDMLRNLFFDEENKNNQSSIQPSLASQQVAKKAKNEEVVQIKKQGILKRMDDMTSSNLLLNENSPNIPEVDEVLSYYKEDSIVRAKGKKNEFEQTDRMGASIAFEESDISHINKSKDKILKNSILNQIKSQKGKVRGQQIENNEMSNFFSEYQSNLFKGSNDQEDPDPSPTAQDKFSSKESGGDEGQTYEDNRYFSKTNQNASYSEKDETFIAENLTEILKSGNKLKKLKSTLKKDDTFLALENDDQEKQKIMLNVSQVEMMKKMIRQLEKENQQLKQPQAARIRDPSPVGRVPEAHKNGFKRAEMARLEVDDLDAPRTFKELVEKLPKKSYSNIHSRKQDKGKPQ